MRQVATALIAIAWLAIAATDPASAQPPATVAVGFRNLTDTDLIVQGYTVVNGSIRRGTLLSVSKKGGMAFESNVPMGLRFYTVHDANQPSSRILLRDQSVTIQNRNVSFGIIPSKTDPNKVQLVPDR